MLWKQLELNSFLIKLVKKVTDEGQHSIVISDLIENDLFNKLNSCAFEREL